MLSKQPSVFKMVHDALRRGEASIRWRYRKFCVYTGWKSYWRSEKMKLSA